MPTDPPAPFHPGATRRVRATVRVGVGVIVKKGSVFYAGIRQGSHGAGTLALPGGHLEVYESWEECARREVQEEMGVTLDDVKFLHVTNDIMREEEKHYVTIFMGGSMSSDATPRTCEPDKCEGWNEYTWEDIKSSDKLFGPLAKLVQEEPQAVLEFLQGDD